VCCTYLSLRHKIQVVHTRSYVPSVIALFLRRLGLRFIFDMRGFWADERVDAGNWSKQSAVYRGAKWFERRFLLSADVVVSLTRAGVAVMKTFPYLQNRATRFEVIPTCTNLELFRPPSDSEARQGSPDHPFTVGYVGTVTGWYIFPPVLVAFDRIRQRRPDARLLIVNRGQHDFIRSELARQGIPESVVEMKETNHAKVPAEMHRMNATVFFIKPVYSKKASAPTKLGEFLGCGVPCLTNAGVGDVEEVVQGERVGVLLRGFDKDAVGRAADDLVRLTDDASVRDRCVRAARKHFALEDGVSAYNRIYHSLLENGRGRR
jgi:glycosyltransferase involved in cell wall biosynthesis